MAERFFGTWELTPTEDLSLLETCRAGNNYPPPTSFPEPKIQTKSATVHFCGGSTAERILSILNASESGVESQSDQDRPGSSSPEIVNLGDSTDDNQNSADHGQNGEDENSEDDYEAGFSSEDITYSPPPKVWYELSPVKPAKNRLRELVHTTARNAMMESVGITEEGLRDLLKKFQKETIKITRKECRRFH